MQKVRTQVLACLAMVASWQPGCGGPGVAPPTPVLGDGPMEVRGLKSPRAFRDVEDESARSAALFAEASKVLLHPRCVNCHPGDSRPRQGAALTLHVPPIHGGPDGRGVVGLRCTSCHQTENFDSAEVPGAPNWHLAPNSMGWMGKSQADVCASLKDESKNGGRSLEEVVQHIGHDPLVAWGWNPGGAREAVPGNQETLAALMQAWADSGAVCPR